MAQNGHSFEVFGMRQKAAEAFDYFVCGVAGAIFTYIVKDYSAQKLAFDASALHPVALLFLGASFFAGLKRIETAIRCASYDIMRLRAIEKADDLGKALREYPAPSFDPKTLQQHTPDSLLQERQLCLAEEGVAEKLLKEENTKGALYQKLRNTFLILGFATIFFAKILQPYARPVSDSKTNAVDVNTPIRVLLQSTNPPAATNTARWFR